MNESGEVKLEYALRGDSLLHISYFDHLRGIEKGRPTDLNCSECAAAVVPVLGFEVSDHYRHLSATTCGLGGESALHFNAKISLAQKMSEYRRASLIYRCRACSNFYPFLEIGPYNRVEPEIKIASRRPDITCFSDAAVVGLAEILKTHAVSFEKKNELNALGCPWFEIPAINVHRQYFKFIQGADVLSIDATGAGITYPLVPNICEVCSPIEALRAKNLRILQGQSINYSPSNNSVVEFEEWQKMANRRRAGVIEEWKKFKAQPLPHTYQEDLNLGMRLAAAGVTPEVDEWGLRPSTPGLNNRIYMWLVNKRKERWLAQNKTAKRHDAED